MMPTSSSDSDLPVEPASSAEFPAYDDSVDLGHLLDPDGDEDYDC